MNKSELLVAIAGLADNDPKIAHAATIVSGVPEPGQPLNYRLYRMGEVAKAINVSRPTLWRMIQENLIKTVEVRRGSKRIPESELRRLVGAQ